MVDGIHASSEAIANYLLALDGSGKFPTAVLYTGTGPNQIVQLDSSSRLPAVDGSQLTNISATATHAATADYATLAGTASSAATADYAALAGTASTAAYATNADMVDGLHASELGGLTTAEGDARYVLLGPETLQTTAFAISVESSASSGTGVYGKATGSSGVGVYGFASAEGAGVENYGGRFIAAGGDGVGVRGIATATGSENYVPDLQDKEFLHMLVELQV
jgi:hypothetical protein